MQDNKLREALEMAELMYRYINGGLSREEERRLQEWINADTGNRQLVEALMNDTGREEKLRLLRQYDVTAAWKRAAGKLVATNAPVKKRGRLRSYAAIAATVALLLGSVGMGIYFAHHNNNKLQQPLTEQSTRADVPPGNAKARLVLANGNNILLDDHKDSTFTIDNARAHQQHGSLSLLRTGKPPAQEPLQYNLLYTPRGGEYQLVLEDGTRVWLNAATSLRFPSHFSGRERLVELSGEAYFDVAGDAAKPFIVSVNGTRIQVLGTTFNVKAYPEEGNIKTTLVTGLVKVAYRNEEVTLQPGKTATIPENGSAQVATADVAMVTAWMKGQFLFRNTDIPSVMQQLTRWYNINVEYAPGFRPGGNFTGRISRQEPLSRLLQMMELTGVAKFRIKDRIVTVLPYQ